MQVCYYITLHYIIFIKRFIQYNCSKALSTRLSVDTLVIHTLQTIGLLNVHIYIYIHNKFTNHVRILQ